MINVLKNNIKKTLKNFVKNLEDIVEMYYFCTR